MGGDYFLSKLGQPEPRPQAVQGPVAAPATSGPAMPQSGPPPGGQPPEVERPPFGGTPAKPEAPEAENPFQKGDFVINPWAYGSDVILQVHQPAGRLTFVVGDIFDEPTPVLTADLQSVQDSIGSDTDPNEAADVEAVHRTLSALRTSVLRTANDAGILRVQMLKEGIDRLAPAILALGAAGAGVFLTYHALKGMVESMLREKQQARQESQDYSPDDPYFHF